MLALVSPEIEKYAVEHTSPLPGHLEELTRFTYEKMSMPGMLSGPIEGTLLQFLAWATDARRVLEIGCFTGFSAQMMAAALPEGGTVVTCEIDPETARVAQAHFDKSPQGHKIDLRLGPALETIRTLDGPVDLVFIDADKTGYVDYYERSLDLLADKGIIVVDNVLWGGRVLHPESEEDHAIAAFNTHVAQDPRVRHVLLPIRDGVMLVRRA